MLTDAKIKAAKSKDRAYKLSDSGQLYLLVTPAGGRHWRLNYAYGKNAKGAPAQKTLALGSYPSKTLSEARARRDEAKAQLRDGPDPAMQRRLALRATRDSQQNTLEMMARKWHAQRQSTWSKIHASDVLHSLQRDVFPAIGSWGLADITAQWSSTCSSGWRSVALSKRLIGFGSASQMSSSTRLRSARRRPTRQRACPRR